MSKLGEGAYGSVVKQQNLAVKKFQKLSHIIQEHTALIYLNDCKYIVHGKGVNYDKLELSMDLYDMSLRKWISNNGCPCPECSKTNHYDKILHDILCGLVELQDRGLSHSDLKPGNILIIQDPFKVVLGDCGFVSIAKYSKQQRTAQSHRDLIVENDDKHDMFSFGVIMLELLYHVKPTVREAYKEYQTIIKKKVKNKIHHDLLKKLLCENREERPCAREVLNLLYHEEPKKYEIGHFNDQIIKELNNIYDKTKLKNYKLIIKHNQKELNINRTLAGYNAFLIYIYNHNIDIKQLDYYFVATLCILSSLFNTKSACIDSIIENCKIKISKRRLNQVIYELTNDVNFVNALFYIY